MTTLQLEFKYLSHLTGRNDFRLKVEAAEDAVAEQQAKIEVSALQLYT